MNSKNTATLYYEDNKKMREGVYCSKPLIYKNLTANTPKEKFEELIYNLLDENVYIWGLDKVIIDNKIFVIDKDMMKLHKQKHDEYMDFTEKLVETHIKNTP
jgi:hypothetical protein